MEAVEEERNRSGAFTSLKDFVERMTGKELNKRIIENFIKSGAFDCLDGTRKQMMMIYIQVMDA